MNDLSTWLVSDSTVLRNTELYKQGILLPDRNIPMEQCDYILCKDDVVVDDPHKTL